MDKQFNLYSTVLYKTVAQEQRRVIARSLLHILTLVCFLTGIYFCREYMLMPDRVIIMDDAGNLYRGSSRHVLCRETAEDIARRSTSAFLNRSFKQDNKASCEALFGRSAQKSVENILSETRDEFEDQKIRQASVIENIEIVEASEPDQCLAFVSGTLHRTGVYLSIPYYQKLEFNLGLRLMRSPDSRTYPLRVLKMTYDEKSVYDNKKERNERNES